MRYGRPASERVLGRLVVDVAGCWIWQGAQNAKGYGVVRVDGRNVLVHRFVYELHVGPIPDGLQLDHLCRTPACANPAHLEPVTSAENSRRGVSHQALKTHCPHGHEYTPENTIIRPNGRVCRTCQRAANRRYKQKLRQGVVA